MQNQKDQFERKGSSFGKKQYNRWIKVTLDGSAYYRPFDKKRDRKRQKGSPLCNCCKKSAWPLDMPEKCSCSNWEMPSTYDENCIQEMPSTIAFEDVSKVFKTLIK
jgi:hypothetical protein